MSMTEEVSMSAKRAFALLCVGIAFTLLLVGPAAAQGPAPYYSWGSYVPITYDYYYGYQDGYYAGYGYGYSDGYWDGHYYGYVSTNFPVVYYYYPTYSGYGSYTYTDSYYSVTSTPEGYEGQHIGYSTPYVTECEANGGYAGLGICP
jgi:hypothetical protein